MQLRNPIRSGEMIKGEVSAGCEWREQRQLPAPRSPHPARLGRRGGQSNRRSAVPDLDSQIRGAELGDSPLFPPPRTLPLPPDSEVPYREPGAPAARAGAAGLPGAWCRWRPRPRSGLRREGWELSWARARGTEPGPTGKRERGRRRRRQRLTESAPRPAPGVGAGDRRAGLGAGAREERLTVKSQAKAQKTQRREDSLPAPPPALRKDFPANVGTRPPPFPAAHAQPSLPPSPSLAAYRGGGVLT